MQDEVSQSSVDFKEKKLAVGLFFSRVLQRCRRMEGTMMEVYLKAQRAAFRAN
jgi:membrane protein CcdC involved in cytochrome C biogenesis